AVASAALQDVLLADVKRHISPDAVLQAVSRHFGVALEDLKGKQRDKRVVVPRQIAMYLLREDAGLSLVDIGGLLGGRDHSTVLHGCEKIATELESSGEVRGAVRAVRELYRGEES
ncbi:MAG TPA: helix-turn-helix domain-containing protein, partial [Chloroflexota bacterium]